MNSYQYAFSSATVGDLTPCKEEDVRRETLFLDFGIHSTLILRLSGHVACPDHPDICKKYQVQAFFIFLLKLRDNPVTTYN